MKKNEKIRDRDVNKTLKAEMAQLLRARVTQYREQRDRLRAYVKSNPAAPAFQREMDREQVTSEVRKLTEMWNDVMPYIRKIKSSIGDVLDHNRLTAGYLLFGKVSQGFAAIFVLAKDGFHYEVMEITRSNREALDLIALFLRADSSALLRKWFEGEIVENVKARDALEEQIEDTAAKSGISVRGMKAGIYGALSKYSHVSYVALLEAYDIFHHDFDFERIAGYHWVLNSSLPYLRTEIHSVIITLKAFYSAIADGESYLGLDTLLRKYAPHMYDESAKKARAADFRARFPQSD